MSGLPPPPSRSASVTHAHSHPPQSAGIPPSTTNGVPPTPAAGAPTQQNLNQIVLEYLSKKGYKRTEAMLRKESADPAQRQGQSAPDQYYKALTLMRSYVDESLDIHKPEVTRLLWPLFLHTILDLADGFYSTEVERIYKEFSPRFRSDHQDELRQLSTIKSSAHVETSPLAKIYRENKYRLTITKAAYNSILEFLEAHEEQGSTTIIRLLQSHFNIIAEDRSRLGPDRSLPAAIAREGEDYDMPFEDEGIPGHNPGSANRDVNAPSALPRVLLGALPQDPDVMEDVRAELLTEDVSRPPNLGQNSLIEELDQKIKREPVEDGPSRDLVPLPPPLARDVAMEVQKIRELRDRFKIDPRTGGVPAGVSVVMYTFHNTNDSINCLDFSGDLQMVAAGTAQNYIRIWSLDGTPLPSLSSDPTAKPVSSHRLVGHSGPIYSVSFSPSAAKSEDQTKSIPSTTSRYLLSSSADKTIRLWSLDTYTCLVIYRGHNSPVWDVKWGPYGHYFLSCGNDKTARLWATEHISPLRIFVGHDNDVEKSCFHPNGTYVFTGSADKTVRMWDLNTGRAVRMFSGHQGDISALECSPSGRLLASADDQGSIILWDLEKGSRVKRMRGHGKGGIWSLSWSVESTIIVSGGADMTVRTWDVAWSPDMNKNSTDGAVGAKADGSTAAVGASAAGTVAGAGGRARTRRENAVTTPDQVSVFPTKQSPVYKVLFNRSNLVVCGSAYLPELAQ